MANNTEAVITISSFLKGLNQSVDKQLIGLDEASSMQNCNIEDGNLSRCGGNTKYIDTGLTSIDTLMKYYINNSPNLLIVDGNSLYKYANDTLTLISSSFTSSEFDYVNYQYQTDEIVIFCNGVDNTKVYDGTTLRDLNSGDSGLYGGLAPKGKYIELHKERVWISGDPNEPNRLYFSAPFDPDDWTMPVTETEANQHGGVIDIPTWDGGKIIGIKALFDDIIIFKNKNVHRIFGSYPGNYTVIEIFNSINGEVIEKTIASYENNAFWLSTEGIHHFNGTNTKNLVERIREEFNKINMDYIHKSVAIAFDNKYIIAVPEGTSTVNNMLIIYNLLNDSFTIKRGFEVNSFIEFGDKLLFANNTGDVYEYGVGDTFSGSNIDAFWETGDITFGYQNAKKNILKVYFNGYGDGTIRVTCTTDRKSVYKDVELTSTNTPYKIRLRNKGRFARFRFENISGCNFTIKQPQILYDMDMD